MVGIIKKHKVKKALNKNKGADSKGVRAKAQKAKGVLASHMNRKKGYHNKIAIRVDN